MIGLVLLAIVTGVIGTGAPPTPGAVLLLLGQVAAFFGASIAAGAFLYPRIARALARRQVPAGQFSALMALALAFAALAEALGMHFILGPFVAGLFFDPSVVGEQGYADVKRSAGDVTDGLLAPLFFLSIGVRVEPGALVAVPAFVATLIAAAFLGKLAGAGLPARLAGLTGRESLAVGVGMSSRGAVELIVASIALESGLFDHPDPVAANRPRHPLPRRRSGTPWLGSAREGDVRSGRSAAIGGQAGAHTDALARTHEPTRAARLS